MIIIPDSKINCIYYICCLRVFVVFGIFINNIFFISEIPTIDFTFFSYFFA